MSWSEGFSPKYYRILEWEHFTRSPTVTAALTEPLHRLVEILGEDGAAPEAGLQRPEVELSRTLCEVSECVERAPTMASPC